MIQKAAAKGINGNGKGQQTQQQPATAADNDLGRKIRQKRMDQRGMLPGLSQGE